MIIILIYFQKFQFFLNFIFRKNVNQKFEKLNKYKLISYGI